MLFKNEKFTGVQIKQFEQIFTFLLLIQVLFTISWRIGINPFPNAYLDGPNGYSNYIDYGFGTMGWPVTESDLLACGIFYFLPYLFLNKQNILKNLILVTIFMFAFMETQVRHVIPALLFGVFSQIVLFYLNINYKQMIKYILSLSVIVIIIFLVYIFPRSKQDKSDENQKLFFIVLLLAIAVGIGSCISGGF